MRRITAVALSMDRITWFRIMAVMGTGLFVTYVCFQDALERLFQ